jgi:membrane-bound lytic murein transglycosylase D
MRRPSSQAALLLFLMSVLLLTLPVPSRAADGTAATHPHFPTPALLTANVEFWKQIYSDFGVGDFVLHDRDNLGIIYDVVRVEEAKNQARATALARPEIRRLREKYARILADLSAGALPGDLGEDAVQVAQLWGCPCSPDLLKRAAGSIRVQQGLREKVEEGIQRARGLMPRIVSILRRHEVPVELAALPLVESSFNPHARSKAGAVGLWQFIRSTGKRYLTISRRRDDRRDPIRATEAAARFLRHNYEALGSWPLAIIAYNHGPEGIQAAKAAVGSGAIEDIIAYYSGPRFGFASKNFYAEFLAALEIVRPLIGKHAPPHETHTRLASAPKPS